MSTVEHVYETIVDSSPERVWKALTDGEETQKFFFGTRVESDWNAGSVYSYYDQDGNLSSDGVIQEITPNSHLKTSWKPVWLGDSQPSTISWNLQPLGESTLVKLTQADIDEAIFESAQIGIGWVFVLSSLKTLLETGKALAVPAVFG